MVTKAIENKTFLRLDIVCGSVAERVKWNHKHLYTTRYV